MIVLYALFFWVFAIDEVLDSMTSSNEVLLYICQEAPADDDDDDDLGLFADETEEEKKAVEQREAAKTSTKKKESMFLCIWFLQCTFFGVNNFGGLEF